MSRGGWYRGRSWRPYGPRRGRRMLLSTGEGVPTGDGPVEYVGPCRCGAGPHAYYRTANGRLVHAPNAPQWSEPLQEVSQFEIDSLRDENRELEERIRQLENKLAEK
jgi:hypothetical protein